MLKKPLQYSAGLVRRRSSLLDGSLGCNKDGLTRGVDAELLSPLDGHRTNPIDEVASIGRTVIRVNEQALDQETDPTPSAVRAQVAALVRSPLFANSERLVSFLRFVVDETLDGRSSSLKESVIGNAVYGRAASYDPRIDSTVRVEARRLRGKLTDYYAGEGRLDSVRIRLPTGGYVPILEFNPDGDEPSTPTTAAAVACNNIFKDGPGTALAIMPFVALSRDPEDETFAEGLTDEMMFVLGRAQGLRIASRSTRLQYMDKGYSVSALARDLKVDAVLQGTVRRESDSILVTIEVSDPTGFVVWSDRFDAPADDQATLKQRIAATTLSRVRFDSSRMRALQISPGPVALKANSMVLRARQLLDLQTPGALTEALGLFTDVNAFAPDYARGHSGVADVHCDLFRLGIIDHQTACVSAKPAAARSLEIDPRSIEAHTALGTIAGWLDWNRDSAAAHFQRALTLGANARAARHYGVLLTIADCHEEAAERFREARSIEPFSVQQDIAEAVCHYQSRRYGALIAAADSAGRRMPTEALVYSALAHIFNGDARGARALIARIEEDTPKHPHLRYSRAELEAWLGDAERGRRLLDASEGGGSCFARASLAAALQEDNYAVEALQDAMGRRELSTVWIRTDARFDRLRALQPFRDLVERLDLLKSQSASLGTSR
jgi:TolB-like protein